MSNTPLNLTRNQLEAMSPNQRSLRALEQLLKTANTQIPNDVDTIYRVISEASIDAGLANSRAQLALDLLASIDRSLAAIASAPAPMQRNDVVCDYIDFPFDGPHVTQERRVQWNASDGTIDVGLFNGVVLQVGQETHAYVKNTGGSTISNGQSVMVTGAVGAPGKLTVAKANGNGSVEPHHMLGIATQDLANNAFGYVTLYGLVRGINTSGAPYGEAWADGDVLYIHPSTLGGLTKTRPTAPALKIPVGEVVNASAGGSGSIMVRIDLGTSLAMLADVNIPTPANNAVLQYNTAAGVWQSTASPTLTALTAGTVTVTDNFVASATSGEGIKIDPAAPTFGWHDMLGDIVTRGVGATDPAWSAYQGNISAYQFQTNDVAWVTFHIPHDYAPGTDLYLHVHWSHTSAAVVSGAVTWEFECTYAKGHNQAAFPATKVTSVVQNASTTRYQHMIAETVITNAGGSATLIDRGLIEVDGLLMVRLRLTTNTMSAANDPFVHKIDVHYQSSGITTKNKAPNFYV